MKHIALLLFALSGANAQSQAAKELNDRGLAAYDAGDYVSAERLYRQTIPIWEALGPDYAAHLGISRLNLGQALAGQGRRREALPEFRQAAALLRRSLGVRNLMTLTGINMQAG